MSRTAVHIFVDLSAVGGAHAAFEALRVAQYGIEHAGLIPLPPGTNHGIAFDLAAAKKALEDGAGPNLGGIGRC